MSQRSINKTGANLMETNQQVEPRHKEPGDQPLRKKQQAPNSELLSNLVYDHQAAFLSD